MVRFAAGFLHLLTAVMWFGTILYVHLLLKPAYASHGLPRGELIVGWGSIALIAVTGTILTFYRIPTKDVLLHTRLWRKGLHVGKHQAGFDLTDVLILAPHEEDQILRLPVVGKIVGSAAQERKPPHLVAFYFMTFLNLFLVLAVLLIIAVWRWG